MLNIASENKLAVDEVVFNLLREQLALFGFDCNHSNVGYSKNKVQLHSKPYCKSCYSRLEKIQEKRLFRGQIITEEEYRPIETFVDRMRKEDKKKIEAEFEAEVKAEVDTRISRIPNAADKKEDKGHVPTVGDNENG